MWLGGCGSKGQGQESMALKVEFGSQWDQVFDIGISFDGLFNEKIRSKG